MKLTDYHAKYFAYDLTKRCSSDSIEKLAGAVAGAQVDLNPHQVDAALFAFNSPLSMGALLADEVGLGKTIEAGLVLSQRWAERKRRILVIVPANLRKQWYQELNEKFFLPCRILETKSYSAAVKQGNFRPLEANDAIVICSYQFARNKAADVANTAWDLVVMDEAHRLRNVYKPSNVIANTLKLALAGKHKLPLTATGEKRAGGRCLILWRTLSADLKTDNEALEKFLTKLAVNPADTEFEFIYVNGPHTLNDPHNKVHLIEETFQRLMFDTTSFESLT